MLLGDGSLRSVAKPTLKTTLSTPYEVLAETSCNSSLSAHRPRVSASGRNLPCSSPHLGIGLGWRVLEGSWDLVSEVINTLSMVISSCKYSYLNYNPSY